MLLNVRETKSQSVKEARAISKVNLHIFGRCIIFFSNINNDGIYVEPIS